MARCKDCGYRVRSEGHDQGAHHKGGRVGEKVMARKRQPQVALTPKKSAGRGYDFTAVKQGGLPK